MPDIWIAFRRHGASHAQIGTCYRLIPASGCTDPMAADVLGPEPYEARFPRPGEYQAGPKADASALYRTTPGRSASEATGPPGRS